MNVGVLLFDASTHYHVCIIDADHSYDYGYCLGGFWGGDHHYGLFSTEISPLRIFIEIGSRTIILFILMRMMLIISI